MTALSWIFGGKKKEDKPVTVEAVEVGSEEDFAIIQAHASQLKIYPQIQPYPYPPSQPYIPLPYSVLPKRQDQQSVGNLGRTTVQNQLEGVPFVLSPALEKYSTQNHLKGLEDLRRGVFQIAADINDAHFNYDFKLESSILQEASLYKHEN